MQRIFYLVSQCDKLAVDAANTIACTELIHIGEYSGSVAAAITEVSY